MDTNKRILVVDDEVDLAQLVSFQFKAKGFEVQTAGDGVEALGKVHEFKPDLVILDMNMPRTGGIEFYNKICGSNGRPLYPVLVLTARSNVKGLFEDLDIDGFMIKPFDIEQLVHEAELIIKKKGQAAPQGMAGFPQRARRICIVEHDQKMFDQLGSLFLNADYTVIPAKSGTAALEKMMNNVPDVALIHLGLPDVPGDMVILKLNRMAKTMDVKFVLYTSRDAKHAPAVMERIRAKTGIMTLVEYNELEELLDKVNGLF